MGSSRPDKNNDHEASPAKLEATWSKVLSGKNRLRHGQTMTKYVDVSPFEWLEGRLLPSDHEILTATMTHRPRIANSDEQEFRCTFQAILKSYA